MNLVAMVGRLTADPENRSTASGKSMTSFRIAVDRGYVSSSGEREADFFPVVCWDKLADVCGRNLYKGRLVGIKGRLQTRSYEVEDGSKRYVTEIIADNVDFLDSKKDSSDTADTSNAPASPLDDVPF